jgi:probable HAF family extracellular repeat protein
MKRKRRTLVYASAAAGILLLFLLWPRPNALYRVTILASLGGGATAATGINDRGQVTGFAQTADGTFHFFLWDREKGRAGPGAGP